MYCTHMMPAYLVMYTTQMEIHRRIKKLENPPQTLIKLLNHTKSSQMSQLRQFASQLSFD